MSEEMAERIFMIYSHYDFMMTRSLLDKMPIVPFGWKHVDSRFLSETNLRYSFFDINDKLFTTDDHPVDLYNLMVLPKVIPFAELTLEEFHLLHASPAGFSIKEAWKHMKYIRMLSLVILEEITL